MEITEEKVYAAFGLEPSQGENDPEPAEPEQEPDSQTEPAEPEQTEPEEPEEQAEPEGQSEEERRANAARRRQQETQEAIDRAVREARERWEQQRQSERETFFRQAGLVNPFNQEPITNMEEFQKWRKQQDEKKIQEELKKGRLTQETLEKLIEQNPTVQEARRTQEEQNRAAQQAKDAAMQQEVERQLAEIRKIDPSIKELGDLMKRPYSKEFYEAVQRGNNFLDAFYLATRGMQAEATAEAAKQAAVNNITGKEHLKPTGIGGKPGATVTPEEKKMFRVFNPDASDDAIQRYQNKYRKE